MIAWSLVSGWLRLAPRMPTLIAFRYARPHIHPGGLSGLSFVEGLLMRRRIALARSESVSCCVLLESSRLWQAMRILPVGYL